MLKATSFSNRGLNGAARAWPIGSVLECRPVKLIIDDLLALISTAQTAANTAQTTADNHIADATAAHAASAIANTPAGNIAATDVQAAINELDTEKAPVSTTCVIGANNSFAAGTVLTFFQAAAPSGWTQVTTHNDKAMRVVSGAGGGSGGSIGFSAISAQSVAGHTLTTAEIPSHTHANSLSFSARGKKGGGGASPSQTVLADIGGVTSDFQTTTMLTNSGAIQPYELNSAFTVSLTNASAGSDGSHNHGVGFQPAYIDMILCSKN